MNWILSALQQHGKKITDTRRTLSTHMLTACTFSAHDIIDAFPNIDRVSVYRTLELFESLDIIHPTTHIKGHQHYEVHTENHHHHSQCLGCGNAVCVDCPLTKKSDNQAHHTLFFTTHACTHCAA